MEYLKYDQSYNTTATYTSCHESTLFYMDAITLHKTWSIEEKNIMRYYGKAFLTVDVYVGKKSSKKEMLQSYFACWGRIPRFTLSALHEYQPLLMNDSQYPL